MFRKQRLVMLLAIFTMAANQLKAQVDWPTFAGTVHYLDLSKGNIKMTPSSVTGYGWENGRWKTVSWSGYTDGHVYYILMDPYNSFDGDPKHMSYNYVTTTESGSLNVVNNTDVEGVIADWETIALEAGRQASPYHIEVSCNQGYNIVLDNVWSSYQVPSSSRTVGGLGFVPNTDGAYCNVILIGDNRLGNVHYHTTGSKSRLIFTSAEGDGATKGTLVVADVDPSQTYNHEYDSHATYNHYNSVIGGSDDDDIENSKGIEIHGGTIWAGALNHDNCTAIGAGGNGYGVVRISGGSVTAVTSSTGTAIGGGIGWTAKGGQAEVEISGGTVYAYNKGFVAKYNGVSRFVPATAIGGGSSFEDECKSSTVIITGGTVYAESVGGVCIGGGGSGLNNGGKGVVKINGTSADVTAKSLPGRVYDNNDPTIYRDVSAGAGIGGGTGGESRGKKGGDADVEINGGKLLTGSVGGGKTNNTTGKIGSATVKITGGDIQAQFVMAAGSAGHCSFTMSGGTIHNTNTINPVNNFYYLNEDGAVLWMDDVNGIAKISGGEIYENNANNGGAFYLTGGTLEITGGEIHNNTASTNGGSAYMGGGKFTMSAGEVSGNTATVNGGGFYVNGGNINITGGEVHNNTATTGNGGGFYSDGGNVDITGASINENEAAINGGAFFLGPEAEITLENGSIEGNSASNGGAIYLSSGAFFEYKTSATGNPGFIRGNTASNLGGGIYLAKGETKKTEMKFTLNSTNLGFYDNTAKVGADDIYAYGGGTTTINIPNVQSMNLGGYSIPGATLEWWEDYEVDDTRYSVGTMQGDASNITRYRASRDANKPIWKVPKVSTTLLSTFYEKYLCLTLGFEYGKIEIRRAGLKPNENAIYEVKFGDGSPREIQRVVVYGSDEEGIDVENKHWNVAKLNFLPKGVYTVKEIPWTWYNDNKEASALSKTQTISEGDGYIFNFENSHHDLTKTPLHDEEFKVNVLSKDKDASSSVTVQDPSGMTKKVYW